MDVSGVRSSWEASARKRRSLFSDSGSGVEGFFDFFDHGVEGQSELTDLGARRDVGDPLGQIAVGDGAGGHRHLFEGPHVTAHHQPGDQPEDHQHRGRDDQFDEQESLEGAVGATQRLGHHDGAFVVGQRPGQDPVADPVSAGARGGEEQVGRRWVPRSGERRRDRRCRRGLPAVAEEHVGDDVAAGVTKFTVGTRGNQYPPVGPPGRPPEVG